MWSGWYGGSVSTNLSQRWFKYFISSKSSLFVNPWKLMWMDMSVGVSKCSTRKVKGSATQDHIDNGSVRRRIRSTRRSSSPVLILFPPPNPTFFFESIVLFHYLFWLFSYLEHEIDKLPKCKCCHNNGYYNGRKTISSIFLLFFSIWFLINSDQHLL